MTKLKEEMFGKDNDDEIMFLVFTNTFGDYLFLILVVTFMQPYMKRFTSYISIGSDIVKLVV